ncbi:MAG: hypothetical protein KGL90_14640 [Burkholderiales bacterium]|nr:hypothetical protein [Burkholderiales bacterium]
MDQKRRTLLIGASALPLGLGLSACGGGSADTASSNDSRAVAASVRPSSGGYIEVLNPNGTVNTEWKSYTLSAPFTAEALRYMVPTANRTTAVRNNGVTYVELNDVVVVSGTTYSRSLWLRLETPTTSGGTSYSLASSANTCLLTANVLGNPASCRQYAITSGTVALTPVASTPGQYTLALTKLLGSPATNQVLSGPLVASVDNKATTTVLVQTQNGGVPVSLIQQDVGWI